MIEFGSTNPEDTAHRQVAALPWRVDETGKLQILLVTSRINREWMLPKGWPMPKKSDAEAALIEASEEAGVDGVVAPEPVGSYRYVKERGGGIAQTAAATIYAVRVLNVDDVWDEMEQRQRQWFNPCDAAAAVYETDLARFLRQLATGEIDIDLVAAQTKVWSLAQRARREMV